MAGAFFGVGLLDTTSVQVGSSSVHAQTNDGNPASNSGGGGVHGVHAVAGRNVAQANPDPNTSEKEQPPENDNVAPMSPNAGEPRSPLARGVSGLPLSQTPALVGGKRGHIECDVDVDFLAYWNDPQGTRDREYVSPFAAEKGGETKYLTFQPDSGKYSMPLLDVRLSPLLWNNIPLRASIHLACQ